MRIMRWMAVPLLGAVLTVSACSTTSESLANDCSGLNRQLENAQSSKHNAETKLENLESGTPSYQEAKETAVEATSRIREINDRLKDKNCDAPATSAPATTPASPQEAQAEVEEFDGTLRTLPIVVDDGTPINGDSSVDPRTPVSLADTKQHPLTGWADLVNRVGNEQWYKDGVTARKTKTGFGWSDVEHFADCTKGFEVRVITVHHKNITDQQARDAVRPLIGDVANTLEVYRFPGDIINTRGLSEHKMDDFVDPREMVRVELARPLFGGEDKCAPTGVDPRSGVQIDCGNNVWIPKKVTPVAPPTTASPTTGSTPTTVAPPTTPPAPPTTPRTTTPRTTTPPAPPTTPPTTTGKVAPTRTNVNDPDVPQRPNVPAPSTAPRPTTAAPAPTTRPTQQPTMTETPPEVQSTYTAPSATAAPSPNVPINCDEDDNGIPDDKPGC